MFKDYSGSIAIMNGRNKIRSSRPRAAIASREIMSPTGLQKKVFGVMLMVTLVIGISSTFWYGMQVQVALDQIGTVKDANSKLSDENRLLIAQRDLLLTRQQMEEAVQILGLAPPSKKQLRYQK